MGPFSAFANNLLDIIFTSLFGFVGTFWSPPLLRIFERRADML